MGNKDIEFEVGGGQWNITKLRLFLSNVVLRHYNSLSFVMFLLVFFCDVYLSLE